MKFIRSFGTNEWAKSIGQRLIHELAATYLEIEGLQKQALRLGAIIKQFDERRTANGWFDPQAGAKHRESA